MMNADSGRGDPRARVEGSGLAAVAASMLSGLDPDAIYDSIAREARSLLRADRCAIFAAHAGDEAREFRCLAGAGLSEEFVRAARLQAGVGVVGMAVAERRPIVIQDVAADPTLADPAGRRATGLPDDCQAILACPILIREKAWGAIAVCDHSPRRFGEDDIQTLISCSNLAGLAIERARMQAETRRPLAEVTDLGTIAREITSQLDLERVLEMVAEAVRRLQGCDISAVAVCERPNGPARVTTGAGPHKLVLLGNVVEPGRGLGGQVLATRAPACTEDYLADASFGRDFAVHAVVDGVRGLVGVPLLWQGDVIGVLYAAYQRPYRFSPAEVQALQRLADVAAIALENARLFAEARTARDLALRQRDQAVALAEIGRLLVSSLDLDRTLDAIAERARELLRVDTAAVWGLDPEGRGRRLVRGAGFSPEYLASPLVQIDEGVCGRAFSEARPVWSRDILEDPHVTYQSETLERRQREGIRAVLAVPIPVGEGTFGALAVTASVPRDFTSEEVALLDSLAQFAGIALDNARLFGEANRGRREAEVLAEITRETTAATSLAELMPLILTRALELTGVENGGIYTYDAADDAFTLRAAAGVNLSSGWLPRGSEGGLAVSAFVGGRAMMANDYPSSPFAISPLREVVRAALAVPLATTGKNLGVMALGTNRPDRTFTEADLQRLSRFAEHVAAAIDNTSLLDEASLSARRFASLHTINLSIGRSLDLEEVLRTALETVLAVTKGGAAWVYLRSSDRTLHGLPIPDPEGGSEVVLAAWQGLVKGRELWREGASAIRCVCIRSFLAGEKCGPHEIPECLQLARLFPASSEPLTHTVFPLRVGDAQVGILNVATPDASSLPTEDVRFLDSLSTPLALAIERAMLYRRANRSAAELAELVQVRTRALEATNRQLAEASRHKSDFLANMSHELRTPLNAIIGFSDMLEERLYGDLTAKQLQYVRVIRASGQHLHTLINEILDLAKVEAGRLELHREVFSFPATVGEVAGLVRQQAEQKGLTLSVETDPALGLLYADPVRIRQILLNFLSNAIKFTPQGGTVTGSARKRAAISDCGFQISDLRKDPESPVPIAPSTQHLAASTAEWVEIEVRDTGIGIRAEDIPRLFQRFTQLDASLRKEHQGTGLGLILTKHLVELHGGTVALDSPGPGQGTRVVVRFPIVSPPPRKRIMVVEDNRGLREDLGAVVASAGWEPIEVPDGEAAMRLLETSPPDAVILDLGLPGVPGLEVLRRLRAQPSTAWLPVLVLTGLGAESELEAIQAGADEFLTKPISAQVLQDTIRRLVEARGRGGGEREQAGSLAAQLSAEMLRSWEGSACVTASAGAWSSWSKTTPRASPSSSTCWRRWVSR